MHTKAYTQHQFAPVTRSPIWSYLSYPNFWPKIPPTRAF